jgi:transcription elongation factor Elf1
MKVVSPFHSSKFKSVIILPNVSTVVLNLTMLKSNKGYLVCSICGRNFPFIVTTMRSSPLSPTTL